MHIYNAAQIREWDAYTITHEPIASIDLMERAARQCVQWLLLHDSHIQQVSIFCGKGNNGGDGLAIARLLIQQGVGVSVYIVASAHKGSADFQTNLERLQSITNKIYQIESVEKFPALLPTDMVIDALFGSGLNKPLQELSAALVQHINKAKAKVIAIDIPSGLYLDQSSLGNIIIEAQHTLTFQCYKLALLVAENAHYFGKVHVLDIGLKKDFVPSTPAHQYVTDEVIIKQIFRPRNAFANKGTYGHALVMAGGYGKIGAAVMCTKSCLHTGAGLVSSYIPKCGYAILQTATPEAMTQTDDHEFMLTALPPAIDKYAAIGIGPGIGTEEATKKAVADLIAAYKNHLVIDADGLNCLALQQQLLAQLPPHSILTPHPKEFERLFGTCKNDFERIAVAQQKAQELNIIIVLKGHHTLTALPNGQSYFNNTGNAGMAKGGSGDVLTGIITSLAAQNYTPQDAAVFGVYLHGLAGDLAACALSMEAMVASDIIGFLSEAFKHIVAL